MRPGSPAPRRVGAGSRAGPQGRRRGRRAWRRPGPGADRVAAGRGRRRPRPGHVAVGGAGRRRAALWRHGWPTRWRRSALAISRLRLTVDPVEFRGFRYENGVSVSIFAPGKHEVLGRGGRYICGDGEPATGSDPLSRRDPARRSEARGTPAGVHSRRVQPGTRGGVAARGLRDRRGAFGHRRRPGGGRAGGLHARAEQWYSRSPGASDRDAHSFLKHRVPEAEAWQMSP